mgnify:FL=1
MTTKTSRKRTWVIALVSFAALAVVGTVTLIALAVYVVMSNVDIADATAETADVTFEETRARFVGDDPLIHLVREDGNLQAEVRRRDQPSDSRPESLHVLVWDPDDERLMNLRIPLWLLRFGDDATVDFSEADGDIVGDLDVTIGDLDHHGPGLVLDYQDADRERVLLWTE